LHWSSVLLHFWTQVLSTSWHFTLQSFAMMVSLQAPMNPAPAISSAAQYASVLLVMVLPFPLWGNYLGKAGARAAAAGLERVIGGPCSAPSPMAVASP
jgi:hypothetical protein